MLALTLRVGVLAGAPEPSPWRTKRRKDWGRMMADSSIHSFVAAFKVFVFPNIRHIH